MYRKQLDIFAVHKMSTSRPMFGPVPNSTIPASNFSNSAPKSDAENDNGMVLIVVGTLLILATVVIVHTMYQPKVQRQEKV